MTHEFGQKFGNYEDIIKGDVGAMLFDAGLCIGCRACQVACKRWNERGPNDSAVVKKTRELAEGAKVGYGVAESLTNPFELEAQTWLFMRFNEFGTEGDADSIKWIYTRVSCMHCVEAPCVYGCPTTALWKHPQGPVEVRTDLCIGCRNCIETCPFDVPRINEELGVVEKCTLCADRVDNQPTVVKDYLGGIEDPKFKSEKGNEVPWKNFGGKLAPACVEACPTDALKWGPRQDVVNLAKKRASQIGGYTYGIEEVGGTNVIYVLEKPPEELGLPKVYKTRISERTQSSLLTTAGVGVVAGVVGAIVAGVKWMGDRKQKVSKG